MKFGAFRFVILFTLAAQVAALLFTFPLTPLQGQVTFAPVPGDAGPLFNSLIFLAFPVAGIFIVLKYHRSRAFRYFYALGETLLVTFLSFLVLVFSGTDLLLSGVASLAVGIVGFIVLIYGRSVSKAAFTLLLSAEAGAYLALAFTPPPTIYFVLLVFAVYDYYSVNYGPLKKVVEEVPFGALSVDFGSVSMGLGDELFYSMIPAAAYLMSGIVAAVLMLAVVDAGVVATLLLLSKRKALPGLTIPLLLALGFFAVLTYG